MQSPKSSPSRQRKLVPTAMTLTNPVKANLYAQKLNNSGAFCIEIGQYDRAIASLGKALRLSELHKDKEMMDVCRCRSCTIEGCIAYSESIPKTVHRITHGKKELPENQLACKHRNKRQRLSSSESDSPSPHLMYKNPFWKLEEDEVETLASGSVYRRPIQVTPQSILEGHNMGSTLFLIIVFNLALAHHLKALDSADCSSEDEIHAKLQTTLRLYDVAESWHHRHRGTRHQESSRDDAMRFDMIVCNNTSHIHRMLNDHAKHQETLERLLSTLMLVVDNKKSMVHQMQQGRSQLDDDRYCDDDKDSPMRGNHHIEEFVQTTAQLILQGHCADAA